VITDRVGVAILNTNFEIGETMMSKKFLQISALVLLSAQWSISSSAANSNVETEVASPQYLEVTVDNVVINTNGLVAASNTLADSIDAMAQAMESLSSDDANMSAEEREALLSAVTSVDKASAALTELALKLPEATQKLTDQLPMMVENARVPIAELARSLEVASDGVLAIAESLPQATENAGVLVDSVLNSVLVKASIFAVILILVLVGALVLAVRYIYQSYIEPIMSRLDSLVGAPEHFANLSKHMKETSDNLLLLQKIVDPQAQATVESPRPSGEDRAPTS
jgi:hypothetical protein